MDITTNYLGLQLPNPLIAGASPLSHNLGTVRALEDAGVAAIVLYSLFEEQVEHDLGAHRHFQEWGANSYAEAASHFPALDYLPRGPDEYAAHLARVKEAVDIPVIPSLNGTTAGGWINFARILEEAGADAIELNIYQLATDPTVSAQAVEDGYVDILTAIKEAVNVPVAVKLGPFFSSFAHFAKRLHQCGADGLVLFNRFYQPDIDLETLEVMPDVALSAAHEMRLPLRWIAILDPIVKASLAATTGVYTAGDVLKLLLAGADAVMLCAALLKRGPQAATEMLRGLTTWMDERAYASVHQMQGSMNQRTCPDPAAFERANYMQALHSYT